MRSLQIALLSGANFLGTGTGLLTPDPKRAFWCHSAHVEMLTDATAANRGVILQGVSNGLVIWECGSANSQTAGVTRRWSFASTFGITVSVTPLLLCPIGTGLVPPVGELRVIVISGQVGDVLSGLSAVVEYVE